MPGWETIDGSGSSVWQRRVAGGAFVLTVVRAKDADGLAFWRIMVGPKVLAHERSMREAMKQAEEAVRCLCARATKELELPPRPEPHGLEAARRARLAQANPEAAGPPIPGMGGAGDRGQSPREKR